MHVNDFFKPLSLSNVPGEEDYKTLAHYISAAKIFSQALYQSVYIIDYYNRSFVYVSDNPLFLCGNEPSTVLKMGYSFYLKYVPREDLELLLEINQAGFSFFKSVPVAERLEYSISYDFNMIQPNKRLLLINHKLTPLLLDKSSDIWLALCIVSVSSNDKAGNVFIHRMHSNKVQQYDFQEKSWNLLPSIKLTGSEREILLLSSQGLTINDIAQKLFLTPATIKFHRQNIFQKMGVRNISEAIACAVNYRLI